ncbi:MAG: TolC family protein, partial [Pseudomonadota bacterium]
MNIQARHVLNSINRPLFFALALITMMVIQTSHAHAQTLDIVVIEGAESDTTQNDIFKSEIKALFEGERNVNFISYPIKAGEGAERAATLLNTASSNSKVDIVLVLDVAANQNLGRSPSFSKPTFLPYVFNARLAGLPLSGDSSGKKHLNYLTFNFDFEKELKTFQSVAPFSNAVLISDPRIEKSITPDMLAEVKAQAKKAGVNLSIQTFSGDANKVTLPANTDAVLYGFFPSASMAQTKALIEAVNARGLVSFSLTGEEYVKLGALATNNPTTDWERLARRTALHMEEVLLGRPASKLPVFFESSNRLMINMATSRQIRVAPSFDILSEALLINELNDTSDRNYTLTEVARIAVQENLSLAAQRLQAESAGQSVNEVRGALLPQIGSSVEYTTRKNDTASVRSGTLAENSTDGSLTLTQSLFSEELWAAFAIEKYSALSERELVNE